MINTTQKVYLFIALVAMLVDQMTKMVAALCLTGHPIWIVGQNVGLVLVRNTGNYVSTNSLTWAIWIGALVVFFCVG